MNNTILLVYPLTNDLMSTVKIQDQNWSEQKKRRSRRRTMMRRLKEDPDRDPKAVTNTKMVPACSVFEVGKECCSFHVCLLALTAIIDLCNFVFKGRILLT